MAFCKKTNRVRFQRISNIIVKDYDGEMVHIAGRRIDELATPDHRVIIKRRYKGQLRTVKAETLRGKVYIPTAPNVQYGGNHNSYSSETIQLAGWVITEGWHEKDGRFAISQSINSKYYQEIESLVPPKCGRYVAKNGVMTWRFRHSTLQRLFNPNECNNTKYIPERIKSLPADMLSILYSTMMKGDGCISRKTFSTISNRLRDDFQEICLKLGKSTQYVLESSPTSFKDDAAIWHIYIRDENEARGECSREHYSGKIWCVTVPYGYIVVRRNGKVFITGNCESALKTSKGDIYHQVGTPQDQRDWVISQLLPLKDKILGSTQGNHEARISNDTGIDISQDIAKALNVPYRAEGILLKISFGSGNSRHPEMPYVYWGYATHGYGGARTASAKAIKVERLSTWIDADFYIMSHDHVVNVAPSIYLVPDNRGIVNKEGFTTGKITAHRKMLVKSGAFIKYGGYSEAGGFSPVDLSQPVITLSGQNKPRVNVLI